MRFVLLAALISWGPIIGLWNQDVSPQVDQAEVMRLGDTVQHVGEHTFGEEHADAFIDAMSPPQSDADKWFISVISMRGCAACEKLKRDWATNEWLLALANPNDPAKSWAHFNIYDKDDQSQAFRWERIKVTAYPTIIVQPPRTGQYGDPSTVVFQGVYQGDPERLARNISSAIRRYIARLQTPRRTVGLGLYGQSSADPPWTPAPRVTPAPPSPNQFPLFDPTIPPADPEPTPNSSFPWTAVLTLVFAGFSVPAAIAVVIWLAAFIRSGRQAAGKPLLLDQATFDELMNLLKQLSNAQTRSQPKS